MFEYLRRSDAVMVIADEAAFWEHCEATRHPLTATPGNSAEREERLDLQAATALKTLLEAEVGPESGPARVQSQNWDWSGDRCRSIFILRSAFQPGLIPKLQAFLTGQFADFQIIVLILEDWDSDAWGHLKLTASRIAVQRNVAQAYAIAG